MSHIKKETIKNVDSVHPVVLAESIKIVAKLMSLKDIKVTNYIFDWDGNKIKRFGGLDIICGLNALAKTSSGEFSGMGLAIDKQGKLNLVGDFYYKEQQRDKCKLEKQVKKVLGGACYLAARILIAKAKKQKTELIVNKKSKQLQLIVEI